MAKKRGTALEPEEKRKLNKQNLNKLGGIFRFLMPYRWAFFSGLLFLLFSSLTLLTFPFVAGKLIDTAQGSKWIVNDVNSIALILIGILAIQSVFSGRVTVGKIDFSGIKDIEFIGSVAS